MTSYDVEPARLDGFAAQASTIGLRYQDLATQVSAADIADGAAGGVHNSGNFVSAYRAFLAAAAREVQGGALALSYFSDATREAAGYYRRTDAEASASFGSLLTGQSAVGDPLGVLTGTSGGDPLAARTGGDPLASTPGSDPLAGLTSPLSIFDPLPSTESPATGDSAGE